LLLLYREILFYPEYPVYKNPKKKAKKLTLTNQPPQFPCCCCLRFGLFLFSPVRRTFEILVEPNGGLRQQQLTSATSEPNHPDPDSFHRDLSGNRHLTIRSPFLATAEKSPHASRHSRGGLNQPQPTTTDKNHPPAHPNHSAHHQHFSLPPHPTVRFPIHLPPPTSPLTPDYKFHSSPNTFLSSSASDFSYPIYPLH